MKKVIKIIALLLLFTVISCKSSFCGCANLANAPLAGWFQPAK